ncbi:hypothetical protein P280DRAFT_516396 [Massarina eburnea CBS 473.64]|uniref:Uncharacterized protein n=1 Tax=Massarina eburnea CBS 473.64 TaxID=1395130 RepID=A0A6A6S4T9_9PLEO|nr:hypothetical protein P280DRAFT_516396 [Massarina eburnea CBS 473.64]
MSSLVVQSDLFWDSTAVLAASSPEKATATRCEDVSKKEARTLSLFEAVFTSYPPVLESLLAQISTPSLLDLYHTSKYLRDFLQAYPLAWKTLSFRLPQPAIASVGSPGNETPDGRERQSKAYSFDALLKQIVAPYGTRLSSLDLCNTAVSGTALSVTILSQRSRTLKHLSVRGCKNVSIKYHIVPFLEPFTMDHMPDAAKDLALKSLYLYRCRHHRRRPYLPSSLIRRDSDSDPTHQLIEICHKLGIWTDTAWCPTPGGRCYRRKDYHAGRAGPQNLEVWVPFDRLWRSSNRIGPVEGAPMLGHQDGRLWEISETGQDGEPLGTEDSIFKGEGKHVPAHLRKSHNMFIEDIKCAQCNDVISERCESCSVRMHCMGCRKTLCASCAFNRPIPRKRAKTRHFASLAFGPGGSLGTTLSQASGSSTSLHDPSREPATPRDQFWWAPGASRSPNLMAEASHDDESSDSEDGGNLHNGLPQPPNNRDPPRLNMHWCCLEPIFSGGGGIAVLGTGLGGRGADKIRAAPLPRTKQFEDPDFANQLRPVDYIRELKNNGLYEYVLGEDVDLLSYLKQDNLDLQAQTCPRGLCHDCYRSFRWKISCRCCKTPICKEHDFRALKFRKCGYRDMHTERDHVRSHQEPPQLVIPEYNPNKIQGQDSDRTPTAPPTLQSSSSSIANIDIDQSDTTSMSQSQVLMIPPFAPTSTDMSASASLNSQASLSDPFSNANSLPFIPVSSSRPRSLSVSGIRSREAGAWSATPRTIPNNSIANPLPLPCNARHPVQWEGCGAYFCQYPRPVGDNRPLCPAILKECTECTVLVCDQCSASNPTCTCTYCTVNYHCPTCIHKKEVKLKCRFEVEMKAKREAELRAREKMEKEKEIRARADEMAGQLNEFFAFLLPQIEGDIAQLSISEQGNEADAVPELPELGDTPEPSPDSITVTTVFGVHEEPSDITAITASGPAHTATVSEGGSSAGSEAALVEMIDDLEAVGDSENAQHDDGDDADVDTDDFDAESALIDEFIDDGVLTPTTTTTASNP